MLWANHVPLIIWGGGDYITGTNQAGKCACSLLNCISATDDISKQNKSIFIGLLYVHPEFDAFPTLVCGKLTRWVNDLCTHKWKINRAQKSISTQKRDDMGTSVQNLKLKMCYKDMLFLFSMSIFNSVKFKLRRVL